MPRPLRTFVALRCGSAVSARLRRAVERLASIDGSLRLPRTDDFHLTLQFLGHTDEQSLPALSRALREAASSTDPLDLAYGGLGAFPTPPRARVVWAAAREVDRPDALPALAHAVGEALGPLGYPPEARAFHPHVTLGRLRRRPTPALAAAIEAGGDQDLGREMVSDLKLILSAPGDRGYHYIDLTTVELGS